MTATRNRPKSRFPRLSAFLFALVAATAQTDVSYAGDPSSGCIGTANNMLDACDFGANEGYKKTLANCINLSDGADRAGCREEAEEAFEEDLLRCDDQRDVRISACRVLGEDRYDPDPLLDPSLSFIDPDEIPDAQAPNPYLSLSAGRTWVIRAGEEGEELGVVHVTDRTREIQGVLCRVVVDAAVEVQHGEENGDGDNDEKNAANAVLAYVPLELTDDWFAQDTEGNVYYCGELSRNFEDGLLANLNGSFEAGKDFAKAGILIKALPAVDAAHRQEYALGEAEDTARYLDLTAVPPKAEGGENPAFSCAPEGCVKTLERSAPEPDASEFKYYLPGTGFVLAVAMEDGEITGEREELVCIGDSLEMLESAACGIEAPDQLLDVLCQLSPETFCGK